MNPVTLEILRHRLDSINEDAATVLARVSGSHIATEANDLNSVIMDRTGRVVACGRYVLAQVVSMHLVVADVIGNYTENPGIRPGDQFITNDPYVGTLHQPDVVVVAPIFLGEELVAWAGSTVHQSDVGGPTAGGITYDASSVFDEAIPMAPTKIVESGILRKDVEREYLIRSRTPELNRLDLLGQIQANRAVTAQILDQCSRHGGETVLEAMQRLIDGTESLLRERLANVPDGTWRHVAYLEYRPHGAAPDELESIYAVRLTLHKSGTDLVLDFTESDDQAPGTINATFPALANFAIAAVMLHLCDGIPWVPGGIWPVVRLESRPGSVVHAEWPAGVAMSTASSCQAIRVCVNACLVRMVETSGELADLTMASCQAAGAGGGTIAGRVADGTAFATMTLDEISGGGGASLRRDGADTSGYTTSPGAMCVNVEVTESYLPLLYLMRAELPDSGGPGEHRGGVGAVHAVRPHGSVSDIEVLSFGQGLQHPAAIGVFGGCPGGSSGLTTVDDDDLAPLLEKGRDDLLDAASPVAGMSLTTGSVMVVASQGGGGSGDPLDRSPEMVLADVVAGLVTEEAATGLYGVVLAGGSPGVPYDVEVEATGRRRTELRVARIGSTPRPLLTGVAGVPLSRAFARRDDGTVVCSRCGCTLGRNSGQVYARLVCREVAAPAYAPLALRYRGSERFVVRHLYCPGCAWQVDVQVARRDEPVLEAVVIR